MYALFFPSFADLDPSIVDMSIAKREVVVNDDKKNFFEQHVRISVSV